MIPAQAYLNPHDGPASASHASNQLSLRSQPAMRGRSPSPQRHLRYRRVDQEEYIRCSRSRPRSRCRSSASPCRCCPQPSRPQSPPPPPKYPTIQVRDYTTQDTDPHGRSFTITLMPDTSAGDIMHSLAPPRSGCEVHVCWGEGRRCLLDPRDDMWEVAKMCWLEVVDV
ncbi:hypothetical protein VUR80DRAFT_1807 [Thermomyces stellatus]